MNHLEEELYTIPKIRRDSHQQIKRQSTSEQRLNVADKARTNLFTACRHLTRVTATRANIKHLLCLGFGLSTVSELFLLILITNQCSSYYDDDANFPDVETEARG